MLRARAKCFKGMERVRAEAEQLERFVDDFPANFERVMDDFQAALEVKYEKCKAEIREKLVERRAHIANTDRLSALYREKNNFSPLAQQLEFLRSYAETVGLEGAELDRDILAEREGVDRKKRLIERFESALKLTCRSRICAEVRPEESPEVPAPSSLEGRALRAVPPVRKGKRAQFAKQIADPFAALLLFETALNEAFRRFVRGERPLPARVADKFTAAFINCAQIRRSPLNYTELISVCQPRREAESVLLIQKNICAVGGIDVPENATPEELLAVLLLNPHTLRLLIEQWKAFLYKNDYFK